MPEFSHQHIHLSIHPDNFSLFLPSQKMGRKKKEKLSILIHSTFIVPSPNIFLLLKLVVRFHILYIWGTQPVNYAQLQK